MERLKERFKNNVDVIDLNLHSSMERLKEWKDHFPAKLSAIYIPVWRD